MTLFDNSKEGIRDLANLKMTRYR